MRALIIGSGGQDGYYLRELLQRNTIDCRCMSRKSGDFKGDVAEFEVVSKYIREYQPDYIFHLAANSSTAHEALFDNHNAISTGSINVLEAVRLHCAKAKVFLSGSAMQFKNTGDPIDENSPFEASSPYSFSRIQSVYAARYYRDKFGLKIYVGYFFNHDSSLRTIKHVNQKIVKAVQRIRDGSEDVLELGNIDVKKEFNFAGDIVDAIWILVNQEQVFEAIIGSGKVYSIRDWLEYCFSRIEKNWEDYVLVKADYVPEYNVLVSHPERIMGLGWKPKVDFYKLADMMLSDAIN